MARVSVEGEGETAGGRLRIAPSGTDAAVAHAEGDGEREGERKGEGGRERGGNERAFVRVCVHTPFSNAYRPPLFPARGSPDPLCISTHKLHAHTHYTHTHVTNTSTHTRAHTPSLRAAC